jgi:hypothetical protein
MTVSPMMIRSNGFNSTLNGIVVVFPEGREAAHETMPDMARWRGGPIAFQFPGL